LCRILKPNGIIIVQEQLRDSKRIGGLRRFLLPGKEISSYEYPLMLAQLDRLREGFQYGWIRRFRLLVARVI
jgi:hypothetical protein